MWAHVVAHYVAYMYDKMHGLPLAAHVGLLWVHVCTDISLCVDVCGHMLITALDGRDAR